MQYTIIINQKRAIELGLNIDEATLAGCIYCLLPLPMFEKNSKSEVWITHELFMKQFPILEIKSRTTLLSRLDKLVEKGCVTKTTINARACKKNYYGLTEKGASLYTDLQVQKLDMTSSKIEHRQVQKLDMTSSKIEHNKYINDSLDNISVITDSKEKEKKENLFSHFSLAVQEKIKKHEKKRKSKHDDDTLKVLENKTEQEQLEILERSISAGWKGLFARETKTNKKTKPHQEMVDFDTIEDKPPLTEEEFAKFIEEYGDVL